MLNLRIFWLELDVSFVTLNTFSQVTVEKQVFVYNSGEGSET